MRSPPSAPSARRWPLRAGCLLFAATLPWGCGEDEVISDPVPTADEARAFFGLTAGSCVRYRYAQGGVQLSATAVVTGPDDTTIAGRTVYRRRFQLASGGLADEQFIEARDDGELRLVRFDTSIEVGGSETRQSTVYPEGEEPLLLRLDYDEAGVPTVEAGDRFEVTTTPTMVLQGSPETEAHTVVVEAVDVAVGDVPYEMSADAVTLLYTVASGGASDSTRYTLVPGSGLLRINTNQGRVYAAEDWRVCELDGSCAGASEGCPR